MSKHKEVMRLDEAVDEFDNAPSDKACATLLHVATQYHADGMIEPSTYEIYVNRVAEWLADE